MTIYLADLMAFILNMHANAYNDKRLARRRIINYYNPVLLEKM